MKNGLDLTKNAGLIGVCLRINRQTLRKAVKYRPFVAHIVLNRADRLLQSHEKSRNLMKNGRSAL